MKVAPDAANNGSVTVTWQNPSNTANIASYKVSVSPNAGTQTNVSGNPLAVTISKLQCGPSYAFTVTAVGPTGLTTSATAVSSRACYSPGAPSNVQLSTPSGSASSLHVTWSKPTNPGIGTLTYLVSITGPSAPTGDQTVSGTSTTFNNLVPGRSYTVTVQAKTPGGTSGVATKSAVEGNAANLKVDLSRFKKFYNDGGYGYVHCSFPKCPTWIQATPSSYKDDTNHGQTVVTVWNGASLKGYCYNDNGYATRTDTGASSPIWIYVNANGHFGYASTEWFNTVSTFGLPQCPGSPPTG